MPCDSSDEHRAPLIRETSYDSFVDKHGHLADKITAQNDHSSRSRYSPAFSTSQIGLSNVPGRRIYRVVRYAFLVVITAAFLAFFFWPSYTHLPPHYETLQNQVVRSTDLGRGNPNNESVFISISLYDRDGHLAGGVWGQTLLEFIDLLGPERTFLSIYENDSGPKAAEALRALEKRVKCRHSIVIEEVDKGLFPTVTMPDGTQRLKRLTYLSEMRNRALRPLDTPTDITYDKIIFFNDVNFDPMDALHLLFSTNIGEDRRAKYTAACGLDFMNPFQLYDVYATRDLEGYSMGAEIFPYFSNAGHALSRQDMLAQRDAVRVKSCWSGIVAMDAKYFQSTTKQHATTPDAIGAHIISPSNPVPIKLPVRWRSEPEIFFDACECCLLMADTLALADPPSPELDTGIYINPYIRVAYDINTLWWLKYTRRVERLYAGAQWLWTKGRRLPTWNEHRTVEAGQPFQEEIWENGATESAGGSWKVVDRIGRSGLYCGVREMQVLLGTERKHDKNWENVPIPGGRRLF